MSILPAADQWPDNYERPSKQTAIDPALIPARIAEVRSGTRLGEFNRSGYLQRRRARYAQLLASPDRPLKIRRPFRLPTPVQMAEILRRIGNGEDEE